MATPSEAVKVDVRVTPKNRRKLEKGRRSLLRLYEQGKITAAEAERRMGDLNLDLTEYRMNGGEWRPLRDYAR